MIKFTQMNKKIKNILRCYAAGMGIKETAATFHTSRNTVRKYVRLFLSSGKSIEQLLSLSDGQLLEMFGCTESRHREPSSKRIELEALLPGYVSRLTRKGTSVRKLSCSRSIRPNTLMVFNCPLSNGQSVSTSSTQRLSVMSSTMLQTGCILILPVTGLKSLTR